jgi:hypothetical protein
VSTFEDGCVPLTHKFGPSLLFISYKGPTIISFEFMVICTVANSQSRCGLIWLDRNFIVVNRTLDSRIPLCWLRPEQHYLLILMCQISLSIVCIESTGSVFSFFSFGLRGGALSHCPDPHPAYRAPFFQMAQPFVTKNTLIMNSTKPELLARSVFRSHEVSQRPDTLSTLARAFQLTDLSTSCSPELELCLMKGDRRRYSEPKTAPNLAYEALTQTYNPRIPVNNTWRTYL